MADSDPRWNVLRANGISVEHLRLLLEQLQGDFSVEACGFTAFHRIPDEKQRAVVSDQICQSAYAITENLLEAKLHQKQLEAIQGPQGVSLPKRDIAEETVERGAEMDMAITGSVRAMGSALDCLGATAIGVLRMPTSITKASFGALVKNFPKSKAAKSANRKQVRAWGDWLRLVENHKRMQPTDWFDWLEAMRNVNIHRGRQVHTLMQRLRAPDEPQFLVLDQKPGDLTLSAARFILHLRNRPGLPDMQDFITAEKGRLWLSEAATITLPGLLSTVNALVEEASQFLLSWWTYAEKWGRFFPPPVDAWKLDKEPEPFKGILGAEPDYPVSFGMVSPHLGKRLELAQKLSL
jgi:hypothetical protein